ncbi:MAG: ArsR/SmtB family transcription factor [bacterium]
MFHFAEIFKALSNQNRLEIFRLIRSLEDRSQQDPSRGPCCVGDICKEFEVSPSTVSHHLKELRNVGLINVERKGQFFYISINREVFLSVKGFFEE